MVACRHKKKKIEADLKAAKGQSQLKEGKN
jgi:hypothetical protein